MPKYPYHDIVPKPKHPHIILTELPRRLIVVGDVHGCLDELKDLLTACDYSSSEGDKVLLVGDLVNKGPLSLETVQYARENGILSIRGNHDDFALCLALNLVPSEDRSPSLAYIDKFSRDDIEWMQELPYSVHIPAWNSLIIHAGLVPGVSLQQQKPVDMVTIRNLVSGDDHQLEGTSRNDVGEPWTSLWNGDGLPILTGLNPQADQPLHIIYGHDARRGLQQLPFSTGVDTGCAYGKQLTALILPERRIVQVAAREVYSPVSD